MILPELSVIYRPDIAHFSGPVKPLRLSLNSPSRPCLLFYLLPGLSPLRMAPDSRISIPSWKWTPSLPVPLTSMLPHYYVHPHAESPKENMQQDRSDVDINQSIFTCLASRMHECRCAGFEWINGAIPSYLSHLIAPLEYIQVFIPPNLLLGLLLDQ